MEDRIQVMNFTLLIHSLICLDMFSSAACLDGTADKRVDSLRGLPSYSGIKNTKFLYSLAQEACLTLS